MNLNGKNSKIQEEEEKKETAINLLNQYESAVEFGEIHLTISKHNNIIKQIEITTTAQTRF